MSQTADRLQVEITATDAGLAKGLADAAGTVRTGAEEMTEGIKGAGRAAASASKEHLGFVDVLREFKTEQVQAGRTARYFAGELTNIIPGAQAAGGALQALIQVGLEGFGIGLAIEMTTLVLGRLNEKMKESEAHAKALRTIHYEAWTATADAVRDASRGLDQAKTKTQEVAQALGDGLSKKLRDATRDMAEFSKEGHLFNDVLAAMTGGFLATSSADQGAKQFEAWKKLKAEQKALASDPGLAALGEKEQVRIQEDAALKVRQIHAETSSAIVRIHVARDAELLQLQRSALGGTAAGEQERLAIIRKSIEEERRARADAARAYREATAATETDLLSERAKIVQAANLRVLALLDQYNAAQDAQEKARLKTLAENVNERAKRDLANFDTSRALATNTEPEKAAARRIRDESQQAIRESLAASNEAMKADVMQLGSALASSWAGTLKGMLTGTKSFMGGVLDMFGSMVDQLLAMISELIAKWLVFNAISGLLGVGGGFGAITMGSLLPAVLGGARADGGPVDAGRSYLVGEKGPERFVPGSSGTIVPNHELRGSGPINVSVHLPGIIDTQGLQRVVESDAFRRSMREAIRNGRSA